MESWQALAELALARAASASDEKHENEVERASPTARSSSTARRRAVAAVPPARRGRRGAGAAVQDGNITDAERDPVEQVECVQHSARSVFVFVVRHTVVPQLLSNPPFGGLAAKSRGLRGEL